MRAISIASLLLGAIALQVASKFTSGCSMCFIHGRETLTAECQTWNPNKGRVLSNLDLNNCIGVDAVSNAMVWMERGNAFNMHCGNCDLQGNSELVMECDCINPHTGGTTTSSINLNDYITIQHDGSLTCF